MRRSVVTTLLIILLTSCLLWANVWQRQQAQFREGHAGEQRGDVMVALTGYESAIRMYLPFSTTVEHSARRIWALGEAAEQRRDVEQALAAYRSLRSAFYATQWLVQPGEDWIGRCDTKIALLAPLRKGNRP